MSVVTRFAPSPTGLLHVGGVRTALFSWLYARRMGGKFILRVEDTDRERSTEEAVSVILEGMEWLGLKADEGPYYQTQRFERYREVIAGMLAAGTAYHCYCTKQELDALREGQIARKEKPRYTGICRARTEPRPGIPPVVRFKNPLIGAVVVNDLVHGPVTFQNSELDDLIIARSDGTPTYNYCVVVDDMDMGITHVIRGDDHLNNTPRQMNMLTALGATPPVYAHVPMILGPDGAKLSKRHGAVSVLQYAEEGYLPDALLNYLVRLGWSHGDQEVFTREEMIAAFDIHDVNKAASAFNPEYEKYGFKVVGVRPRYYSDDNEDALIMTTESLDGRHMRDRIAQLRGEIAARPDIEIGPDGLPLPPKPRTGEPAAEAGADGTAIGPASGEAGELGLASSEAGGNGPASGEAEAVPEPHEPRVIRPSSVARRTR